jgi:hypothetical protein
LSCTRTIAAAAICLGLSFSSGCNPVLSTNPLSHERDSPPDLRLVETWTLLHPEPGQRAQTMVIRRAGDDSNLLQVELSDLEGKAELVSTKIGNVEAVSARAKQRGAYSPYMLGRYEIREQDFLGVWQLNGKMISSAIGATN